MSLVASADTARWRVPATTAGAAHGHDADLSGDSDCAKDATRKFFEDFIKICQTVNVELG
jgi:hypothetical protein